MMLQPCTRRFTPTLPTFSPHKHPAVAVRRGACLARCVFVGTPLDLPRRSKKLSKLRNRIVVSSQSVWASENPEFHPQTRTLRV